LAITTGVISASSIRVIRGIRAFSSLLRFCRGLGDALKRSLRLETLVPLLRQLDRDARREVTDRKVRERNRAIDVDQRRLLGVRLSRLLGLQLRFQLTLRDRPTYLRTEGKRPNLGPGLIWLR